MNNYIQQPLNCLNWLYLCITEHNHFLPRFGRSVVGIYDYQTKVHAKLSFFSFQQFIYCSKQQLIEESNLAPFGNPATLKIDWVQPCKSVNQQAESRTLRQTFLFKEV